MLESKLVDEYNPWKTDENWSRSDPLIAEFDSSFLKREPRLLDQLFGGLTSPSDYGIVTLRGPRRVGKSTLVKLLIRKLIESKVRPENVSYFSLDYHEGMKKGLSPVELIRWAGTQGTGERLLFLDEVSMNEDWAAEVKSAVDLGLITKGNLKVVLLGSHSMDLAKAASMLKGRQGKLAEKLGGGGNLPVTPLRFSEVVESLRLEMTDYLTSASLTDQNAKFDCLLRLKSGAIPESLNRLYADYFSVLKSMFEDYLLHGGYPKAANEYAKSVGKSIPQQFYFDVSSLLISDCKRVGLNEDILKEVLRFLLDPQRISNELDVTKSPIPVLDEEGKPKAKFKLRDYLDYLKLTWTFFFAFPEGDPCSPNLRLYPKVEILDPFLFHALRSRVENVPTPFESSKSMLGDGGFLGRLVESTIASHVLQSQRLFDPIPDIEHTRVLMFRKVAGGELDFVMCIARGGERVRFTLESKYRNEVETPTAAEAGTIVLTKDKFEVQNDVAFVPTCIFLMLF